MALSKVTYVDGVTIIGAQNLNDIQDELIRQGEQQAEDEASLAGKAEASEMTAALALKADKSDTYTKAEVNEALGLKANTADVNEALALKADKTETYTKAQVDSIVEDAIAEAVKESEYSNFEMKSVSGDFVHITDGAGLIPVKDLKIGIDAVQEGTGDPSLENIRPITGWTGAKVTRLGKNLFDQSQLLTATNWAKNADGYYYGTRNSFNVAFRSGFPKQPKYKDNTQYTLTVTGYNSASTSYTAFQFYYTDNTYDNFNISATSVTTAAVTSAVGKTVSYIAGTFGSESLVIFYVKDIQLEEGSTATTYEPYNEHTYEVTWQTEAGTVYGGTLDVTTGELVVTDASVTFDGSDDETWVKFGSGSASAFAMATPFNHAFVVSNNNLIANYLKSIPTTATWGGENGWISSQNNGAIMTGIKSITEVADWRTYLSNNPLQVVYELITPQTYQLTPTEVLTLLGENNIFADTGAVEELIYRISRQ